MSGQPSIQSGYNSFESYSRVNATIDDRPGLLAHALVIRIRSWKDVKIRNRNNAKRYTAIRSQRQPPSDVNSTCMLRDADAEEQDQRKCNKRTRRMYAVKKNGVYTVYA
jgi:hypothetical protein